MLRALLAIALLAVIPAHAQEWPTKPVRMIVPFPPGGGTDTVARPLAAKLAQILGQQVVIDNRGGAGGTIGAAAAAKAAPDGYTVLLYSVHGAVAAAAYKTLPYDLEKDLVPVTTAAIFPDVLVAANRVPAKTLAGAHRLGQGESGQAQLRLGGQRHLAPPLVRALQRGGGRERDARAVQGHRAGDAGAHGRRDRLGLRGAGQRRRPDPRRHDSSHRRDLGEALAGVPGDPDRDRVRPRRLRDHVVVWPLGAGRHARADRARSCTTPSSRRSPIRS